MIEFAEELARGAGAELMSHFGRDQDLLRLRASVKDAVTRYDSSVDDLIARGITERYPAHSLLTEEGFHKGDPDWLWIVDSLDGTAGFASRNPLFSVCIALWHGGELLCGVVHAPAIDETYLAEKGQGAYLNGDRIRTSAVDDLRQSYVLYCEGGEKDRLKVLGLIDRLYPRVTDLRKLGSAGLECAWVAAGKGDAYVSLQAEPWDVAAGVLLVTEAGGLVTDFAGKPWRPERMDLLISNGRLHPALLDLAGSAEAAPQRGGPG